MPLTKPPSIVLPMPDINGPDGTSQLKSPISAPASNLKVYRVEELKRRTFYVTSHVPPSQWRPGDLEGLISSSESKHRKQPPSSSSERSSPSNSPNRRLTIMPADPGMIRGEEGDRLSAGSSSRERLSSRGSHRNRVSTSLSANSPRSQPPSPLVPQRRQILFYDKNDPYYGFTNFSAHPVIYEGKKYPTSEHLFQSFKFQGHRDDLAEHIRTCSSRPMVAFSEARRFQPEVRLDWSDVNIEKMKIALHLKFTQHEDLREELLSTEDAELIEDSDKDSFWGIGADKKGRNELGKALEELREKLRGSLVVISG